MIDGIGREYDDELTEFLQWYTQAAPPISVPRGAAPVTFVEGVTGTVLYRLGNFQVQLFTVTPGAVIPPHHHPNVDSYEMSLWGVTFYLLENGERLQIHPNIMRQGGQVIRVLPETDHGAEASRWGGCFLSIQQWLNGVKPSSVGNDWAGAETMGAEHSIQIREANGQEKP